MAPYTANVHLKDFLTQPDRTVQFVPLGDGELDFGKVMEALRGVGYQGALLCEYEGMGEPKELIAAGTFDEYVAQLKTGTKRSLDYMRCDRRLKRVLEIEFEDKVTLQWQQPKAERCKRDEWTREPQRLYLVNGKVITPYRLIDSGVPVYR